MNIIGNKKAESLLTVLLLLLFPLFSQPTTPLVSKKIESLIKIKPIRLSEHPQGRDPLIVYLPMYFSSSQFLPETRFELPPKKEIISVHLVYTRYRQVDTFDQSLLNAKRFLHYRKNFLDYSIKRMSNGAFSNKQKEKEKRKPERCFTGLLFS